MTRCVLGLVIAMLTGAACGDDIPSDTIVEPRSGSRLALEWYGYTDGARQVDPTAFYDLHEHARCTPQDWRDAGIRCVPDADAAVYTDAACTTAVGQARTFEVPTHFISYDRSLPVHLYRAGAEATPPTEIFILDEGECLGPFPSDDDTAYFETVVEVDGSELAEVAEEELVDGRLALVLRTSADGMRVPFSLRDLELGFACAPRASSDDAAVCAPIDGTPATFFADRDCRAPVVIADASEPAPVVAEVRDSSGCTRHHAVGDAVERTLYRLDGDQCVATTVPLALRPYAVGVPLDLPSLAREVEQVPGRRLQRIVLTGAGLRFAAAELFDTATRAPCVLQLVDEIPRCLPATIAHAISLYATPSCAIGVDVVELAERSCEPVAFASMVSEEGTALHAIGAQLEDPLYYFAGEGCSVYPVTPGYELHTIGPPLPPETFLGALYFGER